MPGAVSVASRLLSFSIARSRSLVIMGTDPSLKSFLTNSRAYPWRICLSPKTEINKSEVEMPVESALLGDHSTVVNGGSEHGRKGWYSNPRGACTPGGFQDRCLKPLGHPSRLMISTN